MTASRQKEVFQRLRQAALAQEGGPTDGELMTRFVARRDGDALEALVRRHGPMVLAVCRRVLAHEQDAEDAFQAAFLVFVRKAASVRGRELIGNWLYGVAYRTALKARTAAFRRRVKERQAANMPRPQADSEAGVSELLPLLDQELNRLPDKYRTAIVLCELEGRPRKEAARRLGVPEGTLSSRLATGRRMLARRLERLGLAPSAGAVTAALENGTASAGVPAPLLASTVKAVALVAAGQTAAGVVSVRVAALAEGVVKTMLLAKLSAVALLAAFAVVAVGAAAFALAAPAAEPAPPHKQPPSAPAPQAAQDDKPEVKKDKAEWGEAVDGVQARLRPSKAAWDLGETPEFLLDMRNLGEKPHGACRVSNFCEIEWDGQWYRFGGPGDLDCKSFFLQPGKQIDEWVKASLDIPWVRKKGDKEERLQVAPGKHTVRVAFLFDGGGRLGDVPRPVSQPVEIEVGKESAWGDADGGVQARLRTPKAVWKAGEVPTFMLDLRNQGKQTPHAFQRPFDCEIEVDGIWYGYANPVSWLGPPDPTNLEPGKQFNDWVTVAPDDGWMNKAAKPAPGPKDRLSLAAGKHRVRIAFATLEGVKPSIRPISGPVEIEVGEPLPWGDADSGVQARLRTPKAALNAGEPPTFILDLRNQGNKTAQALRIKEDCEIEVDGVWYAYPNEVGRRISYPLESGKEADDWVTVVPDKNWVDKKATEVGGKPDRFPLAPGKHTIRIAYPLTVEKTPLRPVSQPVEIEVGKESAWGDAAGGVQARLRTPQAVWKAGEAPTFLLDLRVEPKKTADALRIKCDLEIEVDGTWYWNPNEPDRRVRDILGTDRLDRVERTTDWVSVAADKNWEIKKPGAAAGKPARFPLPAGKHTIRISYEVTNGASTFRPVSGPVEIEIREEEGK